MASSSCPSPILDLATRRGSRRTGSLAGFVGVALGSLPVAPRKLRFTKPKRDKIIKTCCIRIELKNCCTFYIGITQ